MNDQNYRDELEQIQSTRALTINTLLQNRDFLLGEELLDEADKIVAFILGSNDPKELNKLREAQRDMDKATSEASEARWVKQEPDAE